MVNSPPRPSSFTPTSSSANKYARPCRLYSKQKEIRAGPDSGSPVSLNPFTSGLRGSFPPRVQSLGDSYTRTPSNLPPCTNLYSSVPAYGVTQLGLRSYPSGSFVPETPSTSFSLVRSDRPVYVTVSIGPAGPSNLLRHWQDLRFLTSGIPVRTFQADFTIFTDASTQWSGTHMGDSQISGTWTRTDRKLHIICLDLKAVFCALQHWSPVLQGHQVMNATDNSTVVSYINKQGGTHSPTLLRLTVELLLWLEAQNIIVRARHISGCLNVIADHLSGLNQQIPTEWSLHPEIVQHIFRVWGTPEVDMFATVSNSHLPRFMSPIPEPRALAVDALAVDVSPIPPAQQSHSEAPVHPDSRGNSHSPLVAELVVVSTPTSSLYGTPPSLTVEIFCPSRIRSIGQSPCNAVLPALSKTPNSH